MAGASMTPRSFHCEARECAAGRALFLASSDSKLRSFNLAGECVQMHQSRNAHSGHEALRVACREDGSAVASGGGDGTIVMYPWDLSKQLDVLTVGESEIYALHFQPNCNDLLVGIDDAVVLWDCNASKPRCRTVFSPLESKVPYGGARNPGNKSFVFDVDSHGSLIAAALSDGTVRINDFKSGQSLESLQLDASFATSCRFSAEGHLVATGAGSICVWDVRAWSSPLVTMCSQANQLYGARFTNGNQSVLSWGDNVVEAWGLHGESKWCVTLEDFPVLYVEEYADYLFACGGSGALSEPHDCGAEDEHGPGPQSGHERKTEESCAREKCTHDSHEHHGKNARRKLNEDGGFYRLPSDVQRIGSAKRDAHFIAFKD